MASRRKTKTERELAADIHKTFSIFCNQRECAECLYRGYEDCELEYVKDILNIEIDRED